MLIKIKQFVINHYLAIILSVLIGFLMILPQVLFIIRAGDNYAGINILATDNETSFLARFQEIGEGDWNYSDAFWTFHKGDPYIRPFIGQITMVKIGQIFSLDAMQVHLLTKFLFPAIFFLVIYFFVLLFKLGRKIALASSVGAMLWYGIGSVPELKIFLGNNLAIPGPSVFSRPVVPVLGMITLFVFLSFFYLCVNQRQKRYFWLAGIVFGLSFYIYFFVWTFLVVFVSVALYWFLAKKDWPNFRKILGIILLGVIISLPYWFNFYKLVNSRVFGSVANQTGLISSQSMIIGKYLIVALILYFLGVYIKKIKGENFWFWSCLVVSFVIILNQQLITRRILQPGHYHWYVIKPPAIILLVWFVFSFIQKKFQRYSGPAVAVFIAIGFYLLIGQQALTYIRFKDEVATYSRRYAPVYDWLNRNTEKNQIIFTSVLDSDSRRLMSGYTHLDEYLYGNKNLYSYSTEQNKQALFLEYRLDKIGPETAEKLFFNDLKDEIFFQIYEYYYRVTYMDKGKSAIDQRIQKMLDDYVDFHKRDLESEFKKSPVDFILWDKKLNPQWGLDDFDFLRLVYEFDDIKVYEFL